MLEFTLATTNLPQSSRQLTRAAISILGDFLKDQELLHDLDLALTEACANVVRHAYNGAQGRLEITLRVDPGVNLCLEVADWGLGLDPKTICFDPPDPAAEGGRGFFLMKRLTDEFKVVKSGDKNVIWMCKEIGTDQWKTSS